MDIRVVELRRYLLHPGRRDTLIELFDREFVESQESYDMAILGQFRNLDAPDEFVWVRGFPGMSTRPASLHGFYTGAVWRAHSAAANATMQSVDNVLLLKPVRDHAGLDAAVRDHPVHSVVLAAIHHTSSEQAGTFVDGLVESLERVGGRPLWILETEQAENNYPALPVRTDVRAVVVLASFPTVEAVDGWAAAAPSVPWPVELLRLRPTSRSILR